MRKDTTGVPSLKTGNTTQTLTEDKANALNTQFYSVFTKEDNEISQMPSSTYPDIGTLFFNVDGIKVLLNTRGVASLQSMGKHGQYIPTPHKHSY